MKRKIVIKMDMICEKRRSKAMKLVASATGVSYMEATKEELVVIGDSVDSVCLVACLRKKLGHADVVRVEEVKDEKNKGPTQAKSTAPDIPQCHPGYYWPRPAVVVCESHYGSDPIPCSIL